MKYRALSLALALAFGVAPQAIAQAFDHSLLDSVLVNYVQAGRVDYATLKVDREPLDRYLAQVAAVTPERFDDWSRSEQIAFLINAYNAYTLETVVDHYPIEGSGFFKKLTDPKRFGFPENSIRHIDGVFDGIEHTVAGRRMTLDDIEHGTLRAEYNEPRIHFALVCAAVSCPPLREEAYRGDRLDAQLDEQGQRFLGDPRLNRFEIERGRIELSKIFDWFGEDFAQFADDSIAYGGDEEVMGVLAFVSRYLRPRTVEFIEGGDYEVGFLSYDWTLNDQAIAAAR
ncbi:MAG: DUF547 domain-containing protein [Gemmatimonadetes bacterium]|uniref:DUF547 domain-containing protein n=1 Tax=Candidatus Kutchimonas denitrificans TaxID=3056748 RepID=A0AAE4Z902_9BACT|nr:DUF547 domain-containing protein [Gemmatimonadota bacterium]NIR73676.1 DUF547 domain-containing protein [Candidatus Kutchimonas denitrificans]NIS00726.1 DUF547 domain-containing protein [Gemmatimonadota bacterium]NIT66313.1 DUF547 domain-containing protein [Gemmatimonadota bacterium]NIU51531.1 DUF547 domain-containing protein [Gemmatimonadota bacterium]